VLDPVVVRQTRHALIKVTGVMALCLVVFVIGFGRYGDMLTRGIDVACTDAAFHWGKKHEACGNLQQAVHYYRQGLAGYFADERLKNECALSLANILCRQGQYAEAVNFYRLIPEDAYTTAGSMTGYVKSLQQCQYLEEAERLGQVWLHKARQENDSVQTLWAAAALGEIHSASDCPQDALQYFLEAVAVEPASPSAIHAAKILHQQGRDEEALSLLSTLMNKAGAGQLYQDASFWRDQIGAASEDAK